MKALVILVVIALNAVTAACHRPLYSAAYQPEPDLSPGQRKVAEGRATPLEKVIAAAIEQAQYTKSYDPAYSKIDYPNGDVPKETGVCADVIVRAFRAASIDLQKEIHEDMTANFAHYPKTWGARKPDRNIDHRRVGNLMKWFERQKKSLSVTKDAKNYLPGDVVAWNLGNGRLHIGLVTDVKNPEASQHLVAHNIGAGAQIEDVLFAWQVIGHYRYFQKSEPARTASNHEAAGELKIGLIQSRKFVEECGCFLQLSEDHRKRRERYVLLSNIDDIALMNIDGQEVKLEPVERSEPEYEGNVRKGQRAKELYRAGSLNVRVDYSVTKTCPPRDDSCEATWYDATITLTRGNQKRIMKTVGVCGC
jgi:hypothetical protein